MKMFLKKITPVLLILGFVKGNVIDSFNGPNHYLMTDNDGVNTNGAYEGDIILTKFDVAYLDGNIQGDAIIDSHYKWPSATIPYEFASDLNSKARSAVQQAVNEYHSKTCLKFRKKRSGDRNWIHFFPSRGCWSYVGKQDGMQKISLGSSCEYRSTAVHEILHALGFWHEQSRPDRDQYIKIHLENVWKGMEHNFEKHSSSSYNHPYDFDSVMHYSDKAFSKNGKKTITAIGDPGRKFGQPRNGGLSKIDALQVNAHYQCDGGSGTTTTVRPTTKTTSTTPRTTKSTVSPSGCPLPDNCEDKYKFCGLIALKGYCHICWTKQNCALSCAVPDKIWRCSFWAERGYCAGRYEKYMSKNCKKSCGLSQCDK